MPPPAQQANQMLEAVFECLRSFVRHEVLKQLYHSVMELSKQFGVILFRAV